jgi:hypothetical protein
MAIFLILLMITFGALLVVAIINHIQQQQRMRRLQQRRLRLQVEELQEVVTCLEQTLPNPAIAKLVNDCIVEIMHEILNLESRNTEHIEAAIRKAETHSELLSKPTHVTAVTYQRDSDAQIAQTQHLLNEALNLFPHLAAQGKMSEAELDVYLGDLLWAKLMVAVISYVAQGDKCMKISDRFSAHAFYRKAQQALMESMHPDPRRMRLIKELSEMIDGSRDSLSRDFKPQERLPRA